MSAGVGQIGLGALAGNAGKRLWMSEYSNGDFDVTDIRSGLKLSTQVGACVLFVICSIVPLLTGLHKHSS